MPAARGSPTVAFLATWFIGIHGGHAPICPNQDAACNCDTDCGTNRCDCPEAWAVTSKEVRISVNKYFHHMDRSGAEDANIGNIFTGKTPTECAALCDEASGCAGFELGVDCAGLCDLEEYYGLKHQAGDCQLKNASAVLMNERTVQNLDFYAKQDPDAEEALTGLAATVGSCCDDEKAGCRGRGGWTTGGGTKRCQDDVEEDVDPMSWAIPFAAFWLFGFFALLWRRHQQVRMRQQQQQASAASLPPAALQMTQTVGGLSPAAQMQAGGQPAAGYPQAGPVLYGGGAVIAGQAAVAATVPAAGGYPAAAGGGPAIVVYATAAPVAYGNGAPAVDTSAITMGMVLPAVAGGSEEAPPPVGAGAEKGVQPAKGSSHNFCR